MIWFPKGFLSLDDKDRQLLILLQKDIPLKPMPFETLGRGIHLEGADVLLRIHRLQEEKSLGSISAVFNAEKVGYKNYFVAAQVVPEYVDQAAAVISSHPGVTQCARRSGNFNLWFLLTLPVKESVIYHVSRLEEISGCQNTAVLETIRTFKPSGFTGSREKNPEEDLTELEKRLAFKIQEGFPLTDQPYQKIAREIGSTEDLVLKQLQQFQKRGILKRITATASLFTKKSSDVLVLWDIPEEKIESLALRIADFSEVSFCFQRARLQGLPYSLHVVLERVSRESYPAVVEKIETAIGRWPRECCFREKDYKKVRPQFFSNEIENWRLQNEASPISN